jgi:hypothetical protein
MKKVILLIALCLLINKTMGQVNYTFSSGTTTFTPLTGASSFSWVSGSTADEGYSDPTNIFDGTATFTYCGSTFTQFQVSTNGFIRLGTGLTSATSTDTLSGTLRSVIAPLWDSLAVSDHTTDITYKVEGTSGNYVLTVEWLNVKWNKNATSANAQFQVKLYEATGVIEFIYGTMGTPTSGSASIGLANNTPITSTTNPTTGAFLSVNVGGTPSTRTYHLSSGALFNAINNAPASNTMFTFTPVTPSPILTGTYTVGTPTSDYKTLSEMANALNIHGVAGPVTFEIADGTYDDIIHLNYISGVSATNRVTIKNATGATVTLTPRNGSINSIGAIGFGDAVIRLTGSQFVTIDGLRIVEATQNTVTLRFETGVNPGNSVNPNGTMGYGARFNVFKNLYIDMGGTAGVVHQGLCGFRFYTTSSTEADTGKACSYNVVEACSVTGFWRAGVKNFGISGTNPDRGNVIKNSWFGNVNITTGAGSDVRVLEIDCQNGILIENNIIENIEVTIMTTNNIYAMWFNPESNATNLNSGTNIIRGNIIRNLENSGTGVTTGFAAGIASNNVANNTEFQVYNNIIYDLYSNGNGLARAFGILMNMATGTPTTVKIWNNMISDLRAPRCSTTTTLAGVRGIDCQNPGGNGTFLVYNNTVVIDNAVPPTSSNARYACVYWGNFTTASLDLRNNILINTAAGSAAHSVCLFPTSNANYLRLQNTTDRNLYNFGTGTNQGLSWDDATLRTTLADHQTAIASGGLGGPRDVHAVHKNVTFVSTSDLHLSGSSLGDNDLFAYPVTGYTTDIDGQTRQWGYKGADESIVKKLPSAFHTVSMSASLSNIQAFGNGSKIGSDGSGIDFYVNWDDTYLYLGWSGGRTDYSSDMYYAAIDLDPDGTNGITTSIEDVGFISGGQKPDHYVVYENNATFYGVPPSTGNTFEVYGTSGSFWSWLSSTTGDDGVSSQIVFSGSGGEVRLRVPWSTLGGFAPGAGNKLGIVMWNNNPDGNYMWARVPTSNPSNGPTPKTLTNYFKFNTTAAGVNPATDPVDTPLPVELTSFVANVVNKAVQLNWTTATETNNYGFEIERATSVETRHSSSLPLEWKKIGFVAGSGTSNSPKSYSFTDNSPLVGKNYYRLKQIDIDGSINYSNVVEVEFNNQIPKDYSLTQNYPNPFNPVTTIRYGLANESEVRLVVYNVNGEMIKELVNQRQEAGEYNVRFDGRELASGTYIYRLIAIDAVSGKEVVITKKMVMVK